MLVFGAICTSVDLGIFFSFYLAISIMGRLLQKFQLPILLREENPHRSGMRLLCLFLSQGSLSTHWFLLYCCSASVNSPTSSLSPCVVLFIFISLELSLFCWPTLVIHQVKWSQFQIVHLTLKVALILLDINLSQRKNSFSFLFFFPGYSNSYLI